MTNPTLHPVVQRLTDVRASITPKEQLLVDYILENPRKVVFMSTRELAAACAVSGSTVVRFVDHLGYAGYAAFIQALRDVVDTELTLLDRVELSNTGGAGTDRIRKVIYEEISNLRSLLESLQPEAVGRVVDELQKEGPVLVIGSRLSYALAYFMGWSLTKVRTGIQIFKGSDSSTIDWLTLAPPDSLVILLATSRYPNELIRVAKVVRRSNMRLIVITDGALCPLIPFAHLSLVAPSKYIPITGSLSTLACLINCIIFEFISRDGEALRQHQKKLETAYRENDLLFNFEDAPQFPDHSEPTS